MGINKYNSEGYHDPTAYEAISKIVKAEKKQRDFRPLIYVCSPYSGDTEKNIKNARSYCRFVVDKGGIPLAPHLLFTQFMSDVNERDLALQMDMVLLSKCSELWAFGETVSKGMRIEIDYAGRKGYTIRFFSSQLEEVSI